MFWPYAALIGIPQPYVAWLHNYKLNCLNQSKPLEQFKIAT